jgi:formate hydrogenlyase subunit 3/multisubunit Na+/H+ antiporter MnhD subunit
MVPLGKLLVVVGIAAIVVGLALCTGSPIPILNRLGRVPGDIYVRRGNLSFYFPLTSAIVISVAASFVFALLRR